MAGTHRWGFSWGPLNVNRIAHLVQGKRETYVLSASTKYHEVEVSSSRTGRSVRVWVDGKEVT